MQEVRKRGHQIKIGDKEYKLSDFDTQKSELFKKIFKKYNDLEDMVYRFRLTFDEIVDILDLKYIHTKRTSYSLKPNKNQISDINKTIKYILTDNVKISVTIDEEMLISNSKTNQTLMFTGKSFFYTILGFTQSHSYSLDDIDGFYQLIAGSYKSERPIDITGVDKVHLKCVCINGSIVNGTRDPIFYSFALDQPPGHKIYKKSRVKLFKKIN